MSSPAREGPTVPVEEKKKGLSKYVTRMKSVLKRSDGSKRLSFSSRTPVVATASTSSAPVAAPAPVEETAAPAEPVTTTDGPQPTVVMRSQIESDRIRKLGERFKLPVDPNEWTKARADKETFRVEKPIRMRIHRSCHLCNTTFGGNKTCASCQHERCSKCPRYPVKKAKSRTAEKKKETTPVAGAIEVDNYYGLREQIVLTMPSKSGGQPLVRKKPVQRVRRNCHECSALFSPGTKICGACSHVRCTDCPRDPPKKKKYPDGYPGDVHSATSLKPIKYDCHQCLKTFPPVPHPNSPEGLASGDKIEPLACTRCGHERCGQCKRAPPRKVDPAPDPEIWKRVEAKLAALNLASVEA